MNQLLEPEDIATLQEYMGYSLIPSTKGQNAPDNRKRWGRQVKGWLGSPEPEVMVLKQEEISSKIQESINTFGKSPELFRPIVNRAKEILLGLLQKWKVPRSRFCEMGK